MTGCSMPSISVSRVRIRQVSIRVIDVGNPRVGVIMGSDSDLPTMQGAIDVLVEFGVAYEARVISAHRTPDEMLEYARGAADRGPRSDHRRRGRSRPPPGHDRVDDAAAGDRRPGARSSSSTGSTRCSRSCRCRRASRSRRLRSATPATRACSRSRILGDRRREAARRDGSLPGRPRAAGPRQGRQAPRTRTQFCSIAFSTSSRAARRAGRLAQTSVASAVMTTMKTSGYRARPRTS